MSLLISKKKFNMENTLESLKTTIKFRNTSNNPDPEYAYLMDSGFDIRANITHPVTLVPMERRLIKTGLHIEIPEMYELQVRPRSGLALKHGITVLNTPGTVDSGYINEIGVILVNLSNETYVIKHGDRIAQAVFVPVIKSIFFDFEKVDSLKETDRNMSGFGSTGAN